MASQPAQRHGGGGGGAIPTGLRNVVGINMRRKRSFVRGRAAAGRWDLVCPDPPSPELFIGGKGED